MRAITHADPALAYAGGVVAGGVGGARHWFDDSGGVRVFFWSAVLSGTADLYDGWSVLILVVVLLIVVGMPRGWFI